MTFRASFMRQNAIVRRLFRPNGQKMRFKASATRSKRMLFENYRNEARRNPHRRCVEFDVTLLRLYTIHK